MKMFKRKKGATKEAKRQTEKGKKEEEIQRN